jgi:hypothetical protein
VPRPTDAGRPHQAPPSRTAARGATLQEAPCHHRPHARPHNPQKVPLCRNGRQAQDLGLPPSNGATRALLGIGNRAPTHGAEWGPAIIVPSPSPEETLSAAQEAARLG